eukprot:EG_transcript_57195
MAADGGAAPPAAPQPPAGGRRRMRWLLPACLLLVLWSADAAVAQLHTTVTVPPRLAPLRPRAAAASPPYRPHRAPLAPLRAVADAPTPVPAADADPFQP